jgi:fructosamine-3-kinase
MNPIMFQSHNQRCKKTTDAKKLLKLSSVPFPAALARYADQPASKKSTPNSIHGNVWCGEKLIKQPY